MQPVLLFPVVIMVMMAFTLFLKKLKRHFTRGTDDAVNVAPTQPLHVTPPSLDQKQDPEHVPPVSAETSSPAATTPEKDVLIQQVKELKEETVFLSLFLTKLIKKDLTTQDNASFHDDLVFQ